jgi:hypothetical protein
LNDAGKLLSERYVGRPLDGLAVTNHFDSLLRGTKLISLGVNVGYGYGYDAAFAPANRDAWERFSHLQLSCALVLCAGHPLPAQWVADDNEPEIRTDLFESCCDDFNFRFCAFNPGSPSFQFANAAAPFGFKAIAKSNFQIATAVGTLSQRAAARKHRNVGID